MRTLFLISLLLVSFNAFSQKGKVVTITFNTSKVKLGNSTYIEILKYQRDSGNYIIYKRINISKPIISINVQQEPDPIECQLFLKKNNHSYYISPMFYISDEPISVLFDTPQVILKSRQNDFYQKNCMVYLAMPSTITNTKGISQRFLKQAYELRVYPNDNNFMLYLKIKEHENNIIELVKTNKSYYRTLLALYNIRNELTPKTLETCFEILKPIWKNTIVCKQLKQYIDQDKEITIGKQIANLSVLSMDLAPHQSNSFYGQHDFTFVDIWASWCVPCRSQSKRIKLIYDDMDTSRIQIISISIDDKKEMWSTAVKQDSIPWKNYIDITGGTEGNVSKSLNITSIPLNLIVDKTGKIVALNVTVEELNAFVDDHSLKKTKLERKQ